MKTATPNTLELKENINIMFNNMINLTYNEQEKYYIKTKKLLQNLTNNQYLIIKYEIIGLINHYKDILLNKIFNLELLDYADISLIINLINVIKIFNDINNNELLTFKRFIRYIIYILKDFFNILKIEGLDVCDILNNEDKTLLKNKIINKYDKYENKVFNIILNKKLKYSDNEDYKKFGLYEEQKTPEYVKETYIKYMDTNIYNKEDNKYLLKYISLVNLAYFFDTYNLY